MLRSRCTCHSPGGGGHLACDHAMQPSSENLIFMSLISTPMSSSLAVSQGVFLDDKGNVLEGPNSNFAMVTQEGVLVTPPYDSILAGITIQTLVQLVQQVRGCWNGEGPGLGDVAVADGAAGQRF